MPRLKDEMTDTTIYLYPSEADAKEGRAAGGTGFLTCVISAVNPKLYYPVAITNRHIIERECARFIRLNTKDGKYDVLEGDWEFHPDGDDLAASPVFLSKEKHKFLSVHPDDVMSEDLA